jgi:hypothetical protein
VSRLAERDRLKKKTHQALGLLDTVFFNRLEHDHEGVMDGVFCIRGTDRPDKKVRTYSSCVRKSPDQLHAYLLSIQPHLLPKSDAGQAVAYLLKNWLALTRYLEDGDLSIDNNRTERSLCGIAVGRRNWTFLGSDRGGKTMAILRSL